MELLSQIWAGFLIGLLGSLHCLGMCGPIAIAIPAQSNGKLSMFVDSLIYNSGRIFTYSILGAILGVVGASLNFSSVQQYLSIIVGSLMLIFLFLPKKYFKFGSTLPGINKIVFKFKSSFGKFLNSKTKFSLVVLGLLNGLLPCGLVYFALAGSFATAGVLSGSLYMALFGLGTLPMMIVVYITKEMISINVRRRLNRLIPIGLAIVAVLMILRGLSLGIPYISPILPEHLTEELPPCCR